MCIEKRRQSPLSAYPLSPPAYAVRKAVPENGPFDMALAAAVLFSGSTPSSGYWRRFAAWSVDGVRPSSSILDGADLTGASLDGVDLTRAGLEGANLSDIAYDAYTRWPDGFDPSPIALALFRPGRVRHRNFDPDD